MKILKHLVLLLFLPISLIGQRDLNIGITGSSGMCFLSEKSNYSAKYTWDANYNAGVDFSFSLSKRSDGSIGLYFSKMGYKVDYNFTFIQPDDPAIPRNSDISATYLDIPVKFNFSFIKSRKWESYLSFGLIYTRLIDSDDVTVYEDNSVRNSDYLNDFTWIAGVGLGVKYNLNKKISLKLEPQFRKYKDPLDDLMYEKPWAINANLGVVYKLTRK